jgi:exopolysaccharide production protein ExoQ
MNRRIVRLAQPPKRSRSNSTSSRLWPIDTRGAILPAILVALLIAIMVLPQGLEYAGADSMPTSGDTLSRSIWLILLVGGTYLLGRHSARTLALLRTLNPYLLLFVALATASVAWSIEPAITVRRVIRIFTILMVCIGFCLVGWHARRFQNVLRTVLSALLVASVIFIYTSPEIAIHHEEGHPELLNAWHGVTTGKNIFGSLASTCFLLWLHALLSKQARAPAALCGVGLAATCLIMSRSSTSLMATAFALIFMLILLRSPGSFRRYMPYLVVIFATAILIYALAVLHLVPGMDVFLQPIAMVTGKDLTFTGRTDIWYVLNLHIRLHPILGTGYGAYWIGPLPTSPSYQMLALLFFYPTEGHNGYLDVINDLGLVGGICLLAYFFNYVKTSLKLFALDRYQAGLYLTLLFRGFIADMSESHWFSVLSVDFVIMTLATVALSRSLLQSAIGRASGQR